MRAVSNQRVRRRVLQQAVAENVDVIRGLPPRGVRPLNRLARVWLKRSPFLLVPLIFAGSTYFVRESQALAPVHGAAVTPGSRSEASVLAPAAGAGRRSMDTNEGPLERVTAAAFPLAVRRVVLDAGHGGSDPGASAEGVIEKNVTLDIGHRLRTLLETEGFEVVFTRGDDQTIALRDRARTANASKSDIFVSIHVNALLKHTSSRGIETYYLGPTNDQRLTQLAAAENKVSGYSIADMRKLLDSVYADARRDESHELAIAVQQQLFSTMQATDPGLENWGVKRAPFIVLVATDMPAILAEVGCLSNEKEAAMLERPEHRQKIANALFQGIRSYANANVATPKQEKGT
jgi:N-acetylmuramoyl-L-alanine amidase